MSREIKFRAKVIEDFHTDSQICEAGEWVEGFYTKSLEGYDAICCQMQMECGGIGSGLVWVYIPIDINTLGEFTGLKDKNGKEVYNKDILRDDFGRMLVMEYSERFARWELKLIHHNPDKAWTNNFKTAEPFEWFKGGDGTPSIEIIGNMYENPELLRGAK